MLLKQKSSESQLKSVPVLTLWTKKLDFVPKTIKKGFRIYFLFLPSRQTGLINHRTRVWVQILLKQKSSESQLKTVPILKTLLQQGVNRKR